jgi:hypothetical protein
VVVFVIVGTGVSRYCGLSAANGLGNLLLGVVFWSVLLLLGYIVTLVIGMVFVINQLWAILPRKPGKDAFLIAVSLAILGFAGAFCAFHLVPVTGHCDL